MPDVQALKRQVILIAVMGGLFFLFQLAASGVGFYTDWLWFSSLGYQSVFTTVFRAQLYSFLAGTLAFFLPAAASLLLARSVMGRQRRVAIREEKGVAYIVQMGQDAPRRIITYLALLAALGISLFMGMLVSAQWETLLKFLNGQPFGVTDPLFNQDVGFYFFTLPMYRLIQAWLFWAVVAVLLLTAVIYLLSFSEGAVTLDPAVFTTNRTAKIHVMVLAALAALVVALSYRIQIYELVFSSRGTNFGAGYTDANVRLMIYWVLFGTMILTAVLFLVSAFREGFTLPLWGLGIWVAMAIVLGAVVPALVQKLLVEPSELDKERPYIEYNIRMTRQGFGLDAIQEQDFPAEDAVTAQGITGNPDTVNNIRLWDHRPLKDTYNQIQAIRLYYEFRDVDVDRYTIGGRYRQVMLSARELAPDKLATQAQNWVTRRLQFTHGYGLVMSPVTEIVGEGLPSLIVKDLPPQGEVKIDRPQIYYGESPSGYVIVNTSAQEFDFARGDENVYSIFQGEGGVRLDNFVKKLAYAAYFREGNILLTNYLMPESRVLYYRNIQDRVRKVAPFLMLDSDPYLVVADGQLYWIQDAYTHGTEYPYSTPYREQVQVQPPAGQQAAQPQQVRTGREFNYIRNSVKVVINAYDGTTRLYLADPNDPLAATYRAVFPELFSGMDQLPDSLRAHLRYPEDLFKAQSEMFRTFHMRDPQVFYNREDLWSVPMELFGDNRQQVEPYFVVMKLPGQERAEFLQMLPFSPSNKDNMVAWMAARSDGEDYGKLIVYRYPKDKLIYGPMQLESRIDQDPVISSQFTLWNQQGSGVNRGNLLVIPVGNANLYVEPVYLQSQNSSIPELKRVIVSTGNRVVMEPSLAEALAKLYDGRVAVGTTPPSTQPAPSGQPAQPGGAVSPGVAQLARSAQEKYNRAQERLKAGDLAGFGEELKRLEADLNALNQQAGGQP
ncbi:MAG TPA: UPF0182 family protein [Chloroflexota bacterium]|nr:UPF0182 family protein [Chloroflexota bacterium]